MRAAGSAHRSPPTCSGARHGRRRDGSGTCTRRARSATAASAACSSRGCGRGRVRTDCCGSWRFRTGIGSVRQCARHERWRTDVQCGHDTAAASPSGRERSCPLPAIAASRMLPRHLPRGTPWATASRKSSRAPATTARPAWATARAWRRTRRGSTRSAMSTSSTRRWVSCSPNRCRTTVASCLTSVQHDLFDLGGELSIPGHVAVTEAHVARLEDAVERFNAELGRAQGVHPPRRNARRGARARRRGPCAGAPSARSSAWRRPMPSAMPRAAISIASRISCSSSREP